MMLMRTGSVVAGLVLLNALLFAGVAYEFVVLNAPQAEESLAVETPSELPEVVHSGSVGGRNIEDYGVMLNRPLFNSDRLPIDKSDNGEDDPDALALHLVGVVLTPEQQVAIIYSKNQNRLVKVQLWDWIDGWRLTEIEAQGVVLRKGSRSLELSLQRTSEQGADT